jgi:phage-related protein
MDNLDLKPITWVASSLSDLKELPMYVQREIGFSLHQIQEGKTPNNVKPLKGLGTRILEIISDFNKNTYRAVYALKIGEDIYVLHVFQKKSKKGDETPKQEIDLIKSRILLAKKMKDTKY